jgi:hypothetical protein
MSTINGRPLTRSPWVWRLWLVACLLFLWAGLQQPTKRGIYFSVAVVFGIIAARQKRRSVSRDATLSTPRNIARNRVILIVILVALSALAIWLGLGRVAHS